jgi:hypothetical protein
MSAFIKRLIRIAIILAIALFFAKMFLPHLFEVPDLLAEEKRREYLAEQQLSARHENTQKIEHTVEFLETQKAAATTLAEQIWSAVDAGSYDFLFAQSTPEFTARFKAQSLDKQLRSIVAAVGSRLDEASAQAMPGYRNHAPSAKVQSYPLGIIVESSLWGENALCTRRLIMKLVDGELLVDSLQTSVLLYPGQEHKISRDLVRTTVF